MNPTVAKTLDACQCPLCFLPNDCQLCTVAAYKGSCWCAKVEIPEALLAQVSPALRDKTCICRACVMKFNRIKKTNPPAYKLWPGDFYFDAGGLMVLTAAHHLRRGYCCGSGCRHCPYVGGKPLSLPA
jgi:hypothetical protein